MFAIFNFSAYPRDELEKIETVELLLLKHALSGLRLEHIQTQTVVNTREVFTVRRELVFPAVAPHYELADLNRFRVRDTPLLETQTIRAEHYKLSIRCKYSGTCIGCRNLESDF